MPDELKGRVLIIEDNVDANDSLAMLVQMLGYEVAQALDGRAALALARDFRPDVVFCDVGLPGMDGYQVAAALRTEFSDRPVRVAALSGYGEDMDGQSSRTAFDRYFVKPLAPEQLEAYLASTSAA